MRQQDTGWLWSYNDIKIHSKGEFVSLELHRDYSNLLNTLSNAGQHIRTMSKSRKRKKKCVICLLYRIIAITAVWGSEFYGLRYFIIIIVIFFFVCVCLSFLVRLFLGVLDFRILEGSVFSRFGVSWVPEVFLMCDRGAFHPGHFLRLDQNWKLCMKSL